MTISEERAALDFLMRHNTPKPCLEPDCPICVLWDISTTEDFLTFLPEVIWMQTEMIQ